MNDTKRVGLGTPRRGIGIAAGVLGLILLGGLAFIYSGAYNFAADDPHTRPVYWLLQTARDESIAAHAEGITSPSGLTESKRIAAGASLYAEM